MRVKARIILQTLGYASDYALGFAAVFVHAVIVSGAVTASNAAVASVAVAVSDVEAVPAAVSLI